MDRDALGRAGIHLPVLPTLVLGGLPGEPHWAPRLVKLGLDVVASGAPEDTDATLERARHDVAFRPLVSMGTAATLPDGAWLVAGATAGDALTLREEEVITGVDPGWLGSDANAVASALLPVVRDTPARWWVAARGLRECSTQEAEALLEMLVDGVRSVRLFLMKQQFEDGDSAAASR